MSYKILIIEDDNVVWEKMSMYLLKEGYLINRTSKSVEGFTAFSEFDPQLVILDLQLIDHSMIELCRKIRKKTYIPILVVVTNKDSLERIEYLSAGADVYIYRHFSINELIARVSSLLRRTYCYPDEVLRRVHAISKSDFEYIRLDDDRRILIIRGSEVNVTYSEYEIMKVLVTNKARVITRDFIIEALRGIDSAINQRTIDTHIANLRKKIEWEPKSPEIIKTIWGVGYRYMGKL
ncbi:response regulator transcription factor [Paenibacillus sp. NPDC056579]|uniref:response regulator transcription factor n=1 Tax=Paenibacillus sp. NPDC056579 TaxID=3345871 RepID=UPI0036830FA7